jgi:hypothetical protein
MLIISATQVGRDRRIVVGGLPWQMCETLPEKKKRRRRRRTEGVAQVIEHLPSKSKAPVPYLYIEREKCIHTYISIIKLTS